MSLIRKACLGLLFAFATSQATAATLLVGDERRQYTIDGAGPSPKPLIIALHGGGGSAKRFRRSSGLKEKALSEGFAIVWPDSNDGNWNDGRLTKDGQLVSGARDESFILAIVRELVASGTADPANIFITGHSNGGMMSFALGCKYPKVFQAIAPVSANIPMPMGCLGQKPIAALNIVGMEDRVVPFEGGGIFGRLRRGKLLSVEDGLKVLTNRNGCKRTEQEILLNATLLKGVGCKAPTKQLRLNAQGHSWPDLAPDSILSFFKNQ